MKQKIVFASNNENKLKEVRQLLHDKCEVLSLSEIECFDELPETSDTLEGNALQKAQYVYDHYHMNCFADDTGLEVEALDGRPGVYSARYAGPNCSSQDNMQKLLKELQGIEQRTARFRTVIASIVNGESELFVGEVFGEITKDHSGEQGFGYDPIFKPTGFETTFAQMTMEEKNAISHRGRALREFVKSF